MLAVQKANKEIYRILAKSAEGVSSNSRVYQGQPVQPEDAAARAPRPLYSASPLLPRKNDL
jgi:hypothetical protein